MNSLSKLLLLTVTLCISGCFAPSPPKVSFLGKLKPVNFNDRNSNNNNVVIKSEQVVNHYSKQFIYSVDEDAIYSPEFLYYVTHADKIIARIKTPFVEFMYEQTIKSLKNIGVIANIELLIDEDEGNENDAQVILECIRYQN